MENYSQRSLSDQASPVKVLMRITFLKIGEIDTVKECFTAEALIQSKWREHSLDGKTELNLKEIPVDEYWSPKVYVDNTVGEPKETISQTVIFNSRKEAFICNQKRIKGVFLENLELQEFPFDTQDITLTILSELTSGEVELLEDPEEMSTICVNSFVDAQEWHLYDHVEISRKTVEKIFGRSGKVQHPSLAFMCQATRRYGFFFWNVFFVMFFICAMSFATFSVVYTIPQNRLQLTFTLLLTTVAFRANVNNSLPKISYLTYMDKYILGSWALQCFICVWHAIVTIIPTDTQFWADRSVLIVVGFLYVALQVAFALFIYTKVTERRKKFYTKETAQRIRNKEVDRDLETAFNASLIPSSDSNGRDQKQELTPLRDVQMMT